MENEIIKIILQLSYDNELKKLINSDKTTFSFPLKLNLTPTIKVLNLFNESYFDKYKVTLLENALVYAIETKNKRYLNFIKENLSKIKEMTSSEFSFKLKTTELAFKNISSKSFIKNDGFEINPNLNKKTIEKNKELFNDIQKSFAKIESISNYYLNIILDFISNFSYANQEEQLNKFINTKELDKMVMKKYNLSNEDLNFLKVFTVRKILADNFIEITVFNYEDELDEKLHNIDSSYHYDNEEEFDDNINFFGENGDIEEDYDNKTLDFIEKCVASNNYVLPNDNHLRIYMINNFLSYNDQNDQNDKSYEIQTIESNKKLLKTLKQINPLYKFDLIKFD